MGLSAFDTPLVNFLSLCHPFFRNLVEKQSEFASPQVPSAAGLSESTNSGALDGALPAASASPGSKRAAPPSCVVSSPPPHSRLVQRARGDGPDAGSGGAAMMSVCASPFIMPLPTQRGRPNARNGKNGDMRLLNIRVGVQPHTKLGHKRASAHSRVAAQAGTTKDRCGYQALGSAGATGVS